MNYNKYLKYKNKYLQLKKLIGGAESSSRAEIIKYSFIDKIFSEPRFSEKIIEINIICI